MRFRPRIRFSLKTMLVLAGMVAAFLGYTQWRRQAIMRETHSLEADGFYVLWDHPHNPPDWRRSLPSWLWPVVPENAAATYYELPENRVRAGSKVYVGEDEFYQQWYQASDRLRALGVEYIRCDVDGKESHTWTSTHYGVH